MGRSPCCDKEKVKRGPWSPDEDAKLKSYIHRHGPVANWIALPHKIGLKRCGKSCRLRWLNYLRPNIKHGSFSEEEDRIICSLYVTIGSRWSIIAAQLPGRTDNDIKNYWNTSLKKKLIIQQASSPSPSPSPKVVIQNCQLRRCSSSTSRTASSSSAPHHHLHHHHHRDWPVPVLQTTPAATLNNQLIEPLRTLLLKLGGRFDEAHTTSTNNYYNAGTGTGTGNNNYYEYHHHQSVDNYHHVSTSSSSSADNGGCVNYISGGMNVVYSLQAGQNYHSLGGDHKKQQQQGLDDDQFLYINGSGGEHDHIMQMAGNGNLVWTWD